MGMNSMGATFKGPVDQNGQQWSYKFKLTGKQKTIKFFYDSSTPNIRHRAKI